MKRKGAIILSIALVLVMVLSVTLTGCNALGGANDSGQGGSSSNPTLDLDDDTTYDAGDDAATDIDDSEVEEIDNSNITITYKEGTEDAYTIDTEENVITFTTLTEDSEYSISGEYNGSIVIDVGEDYQLSLNLEGLTLVSKTNCPISILSADKCTISAKKETTNYIYDKRDAVEDESSYAASIYALADLDIQGKGSLEIYSTNNNGIHTKDDLSVKNLTLSVNCEDNALKGNDSVTIESGTLTLIARTGDGIKTTNSDLSSKGNQRGTVSIIGGTVNIYAASDGIDAAYNVSIDESSSSVNLGIYTDKYSEYSEEVTAVSEDNYYIRFFSNQYTFSVKYYNSDTDYVIKNASYDSNSGSYYYYSFDKLTNYSYMKVYVYSSTQTQGQEDDYTICTNQMTINSAYDTIAFTYRGSRVSYSWTNYSTTTNTGMQGGMGGLGGMGGGMEEGNTDKGDYSTKGIKAANEVLISGGAIVIRSYDDAIHADMDSTLENGDEPLGNVTISGGTLTIKSNDDGIHAESAVTISNGTVYILSSYEGVEGTQVNVSGGYVSILSSDDGINGCATTGTAINISGGFIYIYCTGDGVDSNSKSSKTGMIISGGQMVVIANSSGNSALDTEGGYTFTGGSVVAIGPRGGMTSETTNCTGFSTLGKSASLSLSKGGYLTVTVSSEIVAEVQMPVAMSAFVVYLGSSSASITSSTSATNTLNYNNVYMA